MIATEKVGLTRLTLRRVRSHAKLFFASHSALPVRSCDVEARPSIVDASDGWRTIAQFRTRRAQADEGDAGRATGEQHGRETGRGRATRKGGRRGLGRNWEKLEAIKDGGGYPAFLTPDFQRRSLVQLPTVPRSFLRTRDRGL